MYTRAVTTTTRQSPGCCPMCRCNRKGNHDIAAATICHCCDELMVNRFTSQFLARPRHPDTLTSIFCGTRDVSWCPLRLPLFRAFPGVAYGVASCTPRMQMEARIPDRIRATSRRRSMTPGMYGRLTSSTIATLSFPTVSKIKSRPSRGCGRRKRCRSVVKCRTR